MTIPLLTCALATEHDVVLARQRVRQVAALVGFDAQDQTRIATAVSEVARNAVQYGGGGQLEVGVERPALPGAPQHLLTVIRDRGPGIPHLDAVLGGGYRSPTGMGLGLVGARRLSDRFAIAAPPGAGTTVTLAREFARGAPPADATTARRLADALAEQPPRGALEEARLQNQELLRALDALRERQAEVDRLNATLAETNRELEETNRGVVALYAELDERASYLARLNEVKTRFLSDLSHELRTPLNAIRNLVRLFLDGVVGDLTGVQRKTAALIGDSAEGLAQLVDDWLDLAKIEAGKTTVQLAECRVAELFGALRGMFRPMQAVQAGPAPVGAWNDRGVPLVFGPADEIPPFLCDEAKVSQILRNFVSNALKFTERGEVRVLADADDDWVRFHVQDTGIGIAPDDQEQIFEEFWQVESPRQRQVKGTGLGLPLSRRLARLLGGDVTLESVPGVGSTFTLAVPRRPAGEAAGAPAREGAHADV
ncbi:ATP-binding protein [Roseisolibacter sp. H3M3-2]|uniref:ATP-binding protein n=1 Tax=Roseisolibacter sp. H3M3-2 TaxID=3031323 RepID=UPI0023DB67CD|nr:ATP-binding protein [Roseisolibacter sp. H3M3-2]MDF1505334.1 ATP-binding protein [Roseisolibacter sp. H3M3-2]